MGDSLTPKQARFVIVTCTKCRGCGKVVDDALTEALVKLRPDSWMSTAQVGRAIGISRTNAANRLAALLNLGKVERRKKVRGFFWKAL